MKTRHRRNRRKTKKGGTKEADLQSVRKDGLHLQKIKNKDFDIVLEAVKQNGEALQYAEGFNDNDVIVNHAISQNIHAFKYVSPRFANSIELVRKVVVMDPYLLEYASPEIKDNKEIVSLAIDVQGDVLVYASPRLQADQELWIVSIQNPFGEMDYAPAELKDNREFVLKCIKVVPESVKWASARLKQDKAFVMAAVSTNGDALRFVNDEFRYDEEVIDAAIKENPEAIDHARGLPSNIRLTRRYSFHYTDQDAEGVCGYHAFSKVILKNIFELLKPLHVDEIYELAKCNSYVNTLKYDLSTLTPEKCSPGGYLKILFFLHLFYLYKSFLTTIDGRPKGWMECVQANAIFPYLFNTIKIPNLLYHEPILTSKLEDMNRIKQDRNIHLITFRFTPTFEVIKKVTDEGLYIMLRVEDSTSASQHAAHFLVIVGTNRDEVLFKNSWGVEEVHRFVLGKRIHLSRHHYDRTTDCVFVLPVEGGEDKNEDISLLDDYLHRYRALKGKLSVDTP